jgi:hypothetical protein
MGRGHASCEGGDEERDEGKGGVGVTTTIWERVKTALTSLTCPVFANTYIGASGTELPDLFVTYFLVTDPPLLHADNEEKERMYSVQINIFNRVGLVGLPDVLTLMKAANFTHGNDVEFPFDEKTGHYGLGMTFNYLENKE